MRHLISLWVWTSGFVVALLWVPFLAVIFVCTAPFDPGRYTVGLWFRRSAIAIVALNPLWKFRTSGVRIRDPRRPYVAVANHESLADIFLISHLPWEMKWLSKEAIFRIPFVGWMMRMAGDVAVRRGERISRAEAMKACRDRLEKGVSVMIMPEGTRSRSGELQPFKDGAFRLAVEMGCPILPIAVAGTRGAMPKGSFLVGRSWAEARVLPPVETGGLTVADVPALRDRVQRMIGEARDTLFHELAQERPGVIPRSPDSPP